MHHLTHLSSVFTRHTRIKEIYKAYDSKICGSKFDIHMPLLCEPVGTVSIVLVLQSNVDLFVVLQCEHHYIRLHSPYSVWFQLQFCHLKCGLGRSEHVRSVGACEEWHKISNRQTFWKLITWWSYESKWRWRLFW